MSINIMVQRLDQWSITALWRTFSSNHTWSSQQLDTSTHRCMMTGHEAAITLSLWTRPRHTTWLHEREKESREQSTMGRHKGLARLNLQMYRVNNSLQCYKSWWSHSKVVWNGDIRAHPSSVLGSVAVWAEILWAAGTNMVQRSTQVARPVTLQRTERDLMQNSFLYFQSKALEARVFAK